MGTVHKKGAIGAGRGPARGRRSRRQRGPRNAPTRQRTKISPRPLAAASYTRTHARHSLSLLPACLSLSLSLSL